VKLKRKAAVVIAIAAIGSITLAACAGKSGSGSSDNGKGGSKAATLIYGSQETPANWNPDINPGSGIATAYPIARVLPSAYLTNPKFQLVRDPQLLTAEPTVTQNPFTVTYQLNPKAVWSDGKPINADDFIFNWHVNNTADPDYGAKGKTPCQTLLAGYDTIKSIAGSNSGHTVKVTFNQPYPDWKTLFGTLLPAHILQKSTPADTCKAFNAGWSATSGKGTLPFSGGPWMISSADTTAKTFTETPNPKYWGPKPKLSKIIVKYIGSNTSNTVTDMQNKEVQMVYPLPQATIVKQLNSISSATTTVSFGLSFDHLDYNTTKPNMKDVKFRQAISMAIDRNAIVQKTVGQVSSSAKPLNNRIFVANQPGYQDNAPSQYNSANPKKALSLLKSDGYTYSGNKLMKDGKQVSLLLLSITDNQTRADTAQLVKSQLGAIGIKVTIELEPADTLFGSYTTQHSLAAGDFDIGLFGWIGGPTPTSNNVPVYSCVKNNDRSQEAYNYTLGCDPAAQKLIDKTLTTTDQTQNTALWNQVDKDLWNDMFTLPLFQVPTILSYDKNYVNIADNASSQGPLWNSETFYKKD
jgi:glutathione transport system substrate-binding protein